MKSRDLELASFYLIFDLIILNLAIILAGLWDIGFSMHQHTGVSIYLLQGNLAALITYLSYTKRNPYLEDSFQKRVILNLKRTLIFIGVSACISLLLIPMNYSGLFFLKYTALFFVGELIFHWLLFNYVKYRRARGINTNHVIIVGMNETAWVLRKAIESDLLMGFKFVGFVSDENTEFPDWLGSTDELSDLVTKHHIEMLFVTLSMFSDENKLNEYFKICTKNGIHLRLIPEEHHWDKRRLNRVSADKLIVINPQEVPMDSSFARISKRLFDIVFSGLAILFIFSWLFPILALIIKLNSKGPVFFIQKRTGINNRIFNCLKFRSMYVNEQSDNRQATKNDSRITPIGSFMRKTNLDEMPQFINVFLGHMSVVGPRPHMLAHTNEFSELVRFYLIRHYVRPGITGWAQVNGFRGITDETWKLEKRVEYDMQYIEGWNFWWDIKIILMTLFSKKVFLNAG
jgi:putative colanic acid biosysnthesis UDP-glucose lipid carrier transferase